MSLENKYNLKSPGVKRLMREAIELAKPTEEYYACPLEDNLFEWHFTVRGPPSTEFEGGFYHGRILLPSQYPMQPPNIILLTPNGRFEINKKICLSISGHHPESWQPSWSIRTALLALIAFMPTPAAGTIGSLDYTVEERQILAKKSCNWECSICGKISDKLNSSESGSSPELTHDETTLIQQIALKAEEEANRKAPETATSDAPPADHASSETTSVRQRVNVTIDSSTSSVPTVAVAETILEAPIDSGNEDKIWSLVICVILSIIILLILRRIFFL